MIFFSILFLILLLLFPSTAASGSRYGVTLWLNELLPILLPFFITIRLFQAGLPHASRKRPFLITGLFCGYPIGASLVSAQYRHGLFDKKTAYFYLGFVNNPSPMFVLAFCGQFILGENTTGSFLLLLVLLISSFTGSLLFFFVQKNIGKGNEKNECISSKETPPVKSAHFSSDTLDRIILESFRTMAGIGGYVILFSILGQLAHGLFPKDSFLSLLGCGLLEISTGASYLKEAMIPYIYKKALILTILSFGGLSAAFQTGSVLTGSGLSLLPYLINKALNGIVACVLSLLLFRLF